MKRKKLLISIKNLDGGTGTFLAQILKLKGFDICVCALEKPRFGKINSKGFYFFGKKPEHLGFYDLNPFLYFQIIKEIFWLKERVAYFKPDVILSVDTHCNIISGIVKRGWFAQVFWVATSHNNLSAVIGAKIVSPVAPILKLLGKYVFGWADSIVGVSSGVSADFEKTFGLNTEVLTIPYGLDLKTLNKLRVERLPDADSSLFKRGKNIVSVGRFEPQKDFPTLVKAFELVLAKVPDAKLILIGDGSGKKELLALAEKLDLKNRIHFLGWQKNVYPYIARADVFVLSTNYEGFGYVLLEAMACGVPVVSSDAPWGPSEVLGGGKYGILTPVGDYKKTADAITSVLASGASMRSWSKKSKSRIQFFSEAKMLGRWQKLLFGLLT